MKKKLPSAEKKDLKFLIEGFLEIEKSKECVEEIEKRGKHLGDFVAPQAG